jgi:hypothetical protein
MAGNVPIWFWRLKAAPYGARLPKRKLLAPKKWPVPEVVGPVVSPLHARIGRRLSEATSVRARKPGSLDGFKGSLQPEEYQYFWGMRSSGSPIYSWSMCKVCRRTQQNPGERRFHMRQKAKGERLSCAQKAIIIGQLLCKDGICLHCDEKTGHRKWGVPICDKERCLTNFMFSENYAKAWESGVKFAEKLNWPKGKHK